MPLNVTKKFTIWLEYKDPIWGEPVLHNRKRI